MNHIVLIGFMGAGKSTIGRRLSKNSGCLFVDTDEMIENEQQETISHIFETKGETYFRDLETQALKDLESRTERMIVAVGGGLPMRAENRELMKKLGTVIYLKAETDTLVRRLSGDTRRPKIQGGDLRKKIEDLMSEREEIYKEAATVEISTDKRGPGRIAREIEERFLTDF